MVYYNNIFFQSIEAYENYLFACELLPFCSEIEFMEYISDEESDKLLSAAGTIFELLCKCGGDIKDSKYKRFEMIMKKVFGA